MSERSRERFPTDPCHLCTHTEKAVNYNVVANVKRKPTRLTLNVKGEGIHEVMEMESVSTTTAPRPNFGRCAGKNAHALTGSHT